MTQEQKERIRKLRIAGEGYKRIGSLLNIPVGTVKSFCRRDAGEKPEQAKKAAVENAGAKEKALCPQCGRPVVRLPGRKKRVFCSNACRVAYWRTQARSSGEPLLCTGCGKPLYGRDQHRKFCSHDCYIRTRFGNRDGG